MWLRILIVSALMFGSASAFSAPKTFCEASMRLKPGETEYLLSRGICHLNHGDTDLAISDLDRFIQLHPDWVGGYFNRANAYFAKGAYDLAIADYSEALLHQPADPDGIFWNRGIAYAEKGDYAHAIENYDLTIRMKPNVADFTASAPRSMRNGVSGKQRCRITARRCRSNPTIRPPKTGCGIWRQRPLSHRLRLHRA